MLYDKHENPAAFTYFTCSVPNTSNLKKTWTGWSYAPTNLSLAFDRHSETKFRLTLPLEYDFGAFVHDKAGAAVYRLVTVIKKMEGGMYAAFVHSEDSRWFKRVGRRWVSVRLGRGRAIG